MTQLRAFNGVGGRGEDNHLDESVMVQMCALNSSCGQDEDDLF